MVTERPKLTGWEQIADHLGVSVRTAQVYEREQGLPVHRLPGPKGRVWAFSDELDSWNLNITPKKVDHAEEGIDVVSAAPISRRQLLLPVLAGSGILAGAVYGIARLGMFKNHPVDWQVAGNTLTILGDSGRELWHHTFPAPMELSGYQKRVDLNRCVFIDLDGAGKWETIFLYCPLDSLANRAKLICFTSNGKIRWEFFTNHKVVDGQSREWPPPYIPTNFIIVSPRSGPTRVAVASVHYWSFPSQIAVLDPAGTLVGEFWHRGHLRYFAVADLRGDGARQVLIGGVNDAPEYKQATFLVFDPQAVGGASCSPDGKPYFQGFGPGTQKAEVFFPRTHVNRDQEFNRVQHIVVADGRITVTIAEGMDESNPNFVVYDFDFQLNVISVLLSDPIKARYREMEVNGEIKKGSIDGEGERLKQQVRVFRRS